MTTTLRRPRAAGLLALLFLVLAAGCGSRGSDTNVRPPELWFYQVVNLGDAVAVEKAAPILIRARRAGYTRVVLADHKFARLGAMDAGYFARARRLRALADSLGLGIVPGVFQVGRSSSMLADDPDLAESLPVVDAPFVVVGGLAVPSSNPPIEFRTWADGSDPNAIVSLHTATTTGSNRPARWWYHVHVAPRRIYRVQVSIRSHEFDGRALVRVNAGDRPLTFLGKLPVDRDQDWKEYEVLFDSGDATEVRVSFGLFHAAKGSLEWRNWSMSEAGPVNVVRRPTAPFTLRVAVNGRALTEGKDFEFVRDTLLGNDPWRGQFGEAHEAPAIRVRLPERVELRGSWEHAAIVEGKQVTCCLSESLTFAKLADEAHRMRALWGPGRYLMMFDEIRAIGADSACRATGLSPGAILARAAQRCAAFLPEDTLYVWGDMFDPAQNAVKNYYLARGDLAGSWEGLGSRVGIFNWNSPAARRSLRWFAGQKRHQVLCGYYDGPPEAIHGWLEAARGVPDVDAILYATWVGKYDDLEAFAKACRP